VQKKIMNTAEEKIIESASLRMRSGKQLPGEQVRGSFVDPTPVSPEKTTDTDRNSSEILKIYLQGLGYCTRKKRRRCLSQELGK
jgi:hypothetical protein